MTIVFIVVAGAILFQLIPLPTTWLQALSPNAERLVQELDTAFANGVSDQHPISLVPVATVVAFVLYGALAAMLLGLSRSLTRQNIAGFAQALAGLGLLLAVVGIVQEPLFTGKVYGFWTPVFRTDPFGPFINRNHFAGWMVMALALTLGLLCAHVTRGMRHVKPTFRDRLLWLSSPAASQLVLIALAAAVMGLSLVMTMSRSGMVAFATAIVITGWFALRRLDGVSKRAVAGGYILLLVFAIVGWVGPDAIAARFSGADRETLEGRLPIWFDTLRIARDFWLTGTGLNTYGTATLFYQTAFPDLHLREAHNDYLQLAAEGGLLVGVPALIVLVVFARDVRRRFAESEGSSYWIRLGAVTGIVAIALQSVVEFSLQMPGNAVLFTIICAIAIHDGRLQPLGTAPHVRGYLDYAPRFGGQSRTPQGTAGRGDCVGKHVEGRMG